MSLKYEPASVPSALLLSCGTKVHDRTHLNAKRPVRHAVSCLRYDLPNESSPSTHARMVSRHTRHMVSRASGHGLEHRGGGVGEGGERGGGGERRFARPTERLRGHLI